MNRLKRGTTAVAVASSCSITSMTYAFCSNNDKENAILSSSSSSSSSIKIASPPPSSSSSSSSVIALYLTSKSKDNLSQYLSKVGYKDYAGDYVVIKRMTEKSIANDTAAYNQYYGDKAAFRLKGIIKTENGLVVGVGKISTMSGEIRDPDFFCSIPLYQSNSSMDLKSKDHYEQFRRSIDIATQFHSFKLADDRSYWKGRVPSAAVLGTPYSSISASFVSFPSSSQIVVDGYICNNDLIDSERKCSQSDINYGTTDKRGNDEDEKFECPVCAYMKAGPCKEECALWDECIQNINDEKDLSKCFAVTNSMMQCMTKYEYYDILTANITINNQKQ